VFWHVPIQVQSQEGLSCFDQTNDIKGGVGMQPQKFEPAPVALHYWLDEPQNAISRMDVTWSQPNPQAVAITGEAENLVKAFLGKMAIVGHPSLLAMHRVLSGIQVDDQSLFILPLCNGLNLS
jgi:hypothetical protein